MKKFFVFAMVALLLSSCDKEEATADSSFAMKATGATYDDQCNKPRVIISGDLTTANGPHSWTNNNVYVLSGVVRVKGTTLTIQAGTHIIADSSITGNVANGVLVITNGAQINAVGTAEQPIVFTSWKIVDCNANTVPAAGDFGGVILLGDAQVNTGVTTNVIEGLGDQPNVSDFYFGGTGTAGNTDSAGTMEYVRIEYAGRKLPTEGDNGVEINGLTFGGVGNGTIINRVQVSWGLDDAFEFFGGTVNAARLVAFSNDDDSFDFDWGYKGTITKAISIANENSTHSTSSGAPDSNGIELDNNATGTPGTPAALITRPVMIDLSIVGFKNATDAAVLENGIHIRRIGQISMTRATSSGYVTGLRWDVDPTLSAKSSISVHGFTSFVLPAPIPAPGALYSTTQLLGFSPNTDLGASAQNWGGTSPYQPFYNEANFNLTNGTTGAFATEANWTSIWTQF